ncbi:restriction endonuclease subunit S [Ferrimonas senticii]|uniref:restriction endonuclease subunit S n=1 Tax=Ferrimonas senticii TaxID=394566 RepID=UPI00042A7156|nr:restriction endonuclease subunit S [Ferrimonas senticii]
MSEKVLIEVDSAHSRTSMVKTESMEELWRNPEQMLPVGWQLAKLSKVTEKIADRDHTTPKYVDSSDGVPIVSPTNLDANMRLDLTKLKYISREAHAKNCKKTDLRPGDIIFSRIGAGLGKSYLLESDFYDFSILHSLCQIRPACAIDPTYLLWFLRSDYMQWRLKFGIQSIGVPDLGLKEIGELPVFYPGLPEQRKIAEILTSVDTVIERTQAQIDKLKAVKTGLMQELLSPTPDNYRTGDGTTAFKDSQLGAIPEDWEVLELKDACSLIKDGTHLPPKRVPKGVPLLSVRNMKDGMFTLLDDDTYVSEDFYEKMHAKWKPEAGDLLLAVVGATVGKVCQVPEGFPTFTLQRSVAVIRGHETRLDADFLRFYSESADFKSRLWDRVNQTAQPGIYLSEIGKILSPIPPIHEQKIIARAIRSIDGRINAMQRKNNGHKATKKALMQDLLTGKVRVMVDSNN